MSISTVTLIAIAIVVMSAVAFSVSESDTLDTVLGAVFYSAVVVSITTIIMEFIAGLL